MKWRRFGTAAVVALIFAEGDSASDSGDSGSDSGDSASSGAEASSSDSGDSESADIGLSVADTLQLSSSGNGTANDTGSSDTSGSESPSSDNSSNRAGQRPPGQPGVTQGLTIEELKDIPLKGDDGPIKR